MWDLKSLIISDWILQATDWYKTYTSKCELWFNWYVDANDFSSFYTSDCEVKDWDGSIIIKKWKSKLSLKKIVSDRNIIPVNNEWWFTFNSDELIKWIKYVKYCVKQKSFQPVLTWIYISCDWERMFIVWANSHYVWEYSFECKWTVWHSILPIVYVQSLLSHLSEWWEFSIVLWKNLIIYNEISSSMYSCIEWAYVPYKSFIKETDNKVKINSKDLLDSINCWITIDTPILHLNNWVWFIKWELNSIEFEYSYEWCEHNINFSVWDFTNLLWKSSEFTLNITDNVSPVTFVWNDVTYVLVPIKS